MQRPERDWLDHERATRQLNNAMESVLGPPVGRDRRVPIDRPCDRVFLSCLDESVDGCHECPAEVVGVRCLCACHRGKLANHSQTGGRR